MCAPFLHAVKRWKPANFEALRLTGTAPLNATGNDLDNYIGGNEENNVLTGGKGNDFLTGGGGSGTYVFNKGDGRDVIGNYGADAADFNKLQFGTGISPADITFARVGSGLLMSLFGGVDSIFFDLWFNGYALDAVQFSGGLTWTAEQVSAMATSPRTNSPPQLAVQQPVVITPYEGQEVSFAFAAGTVADGDLWDAAGLAFYLVRPDDQTPDPRPRRSSPTTRSRAGRPSSRMRSREQNRRSGREWSSLPQDDSESRTPIIRQRRTADQERWIFSLTVCFRHVCSSGRWTQS